MTMGRGRCTFKQSDVKRAIKGVEAAGRKAVGIEINQNGCTIVLDHGGSISLTDHSWDDAIAKATANDDDPD